MPPRRQSPEPKTRLSFFAAFCDSISSPVRPLEHSIHSPNMWTRRSSERDVEDIAKIGAVVGIDADRRALVSQAIAQRACWVAGRGDLPGGYFVLSHRHFFGRDFVSHLAVKASARRRGLASALFQAAETNATTPQLFTSTNQSNRPMQALLKRRGYQQAGVIDHLDPGDREIVFVKYLS